MHPSPDPLGTPSQTPANGLSLALHPRRQSSSGTCRLTIELTNAQAEPAEVQLSIDQDRWLYELSIQPGELRLGPYGKAVARVTARPYDELLPGEDNRSTTLVVEARDARSNHTVSIQGTLVQVRRSRLQAFGLLLGAAVLVFALGTLVFWGGQQAAHALGWFATPTPVAALVPTVAPPRTPTRTPTPTAPATAAPVPATASLSLTPTEVPTTRVPPSPTLIPSATSTSTPLPVIRATRVASPTATPSPTLAPGVYVLTLVAAPPQPQNGQGVLFQVTFLNTTGSDQSYKWCVESFRASGQSHGLTSCRFRMTIPPGESQLVTADPYVGQKVGGCLPLRARVIWEDEEGLRIAFPGRDSAPLWLEYQFCPA